MPKAGEGIPAPKDGGAAPMPKGGTGGKDGKDGKDGKEVSSIQPAPALDLTPPAAPTATNTPKVSTPEAKEPF
jgi:hypothetical protein